MELRRISALDLFGLPDFSDVVQAYTQASGNPDMGFGNPHFETYTALESMGDLLITAAFDGDALVGFVAVTAMIFDHYSSRVADVDAIWLDESHRAGGVGLKLIREAKRSAKELGCVGCYFSAPIGSRLERLYEKLFKKTDSIFWEKI